MLAHLLPCPQEAAILALVATYAMIVYRCVRNYWRKSK